MIANLPALLSKQTCDPLDTDVYTDAGVPKLIPVPETVPTTAKSSDVGEVFIGIGICGFPS